LHKRNCFVIVISADEQSGSLHELSTNGEEEEEHGGKGERLLQLLQLQMLRYNGYDWSGSRCRFGD